MYPTIPFHALPALYVRLKDDMPAAYPGLWAAWKATLRILIAQRRDPDLSVERPPPGALAAS